MSQTSQVSTLNGAAIANGLPQTQNVQGGNTTAQAVSQDSFMRTLTTLLELQQIEQAGTAANVGGSDSALSLLGEMFANPATSGSLTQSTAEWLAAALESAMPVPGMDASAADSTDEGDGLGATDSESGDSLTALLPLLTGGLVGNTPVTGQAGADTLAAETATEASSSPTPVATIPAIPTAANADTTAQIDQAVQTASARYGVPTALIRGVIQQESGMNPRAVSDVGAMGLMQLMPATASGLGVTDPFDVASNVDGGTRYLKGLLDRFHGDTALALAAYNAGPGAVEAYGGIPPYAQTQNYVRQVLSYANQFQAQNQNI